MTIKQNQPQNLLLPRGQKLIELGDYIYLPEYNELMNRETLIYFMKYRKERKVILKEIYIDERKIKKELSQLKQLIFEITQACNLSCVYCVYGKYYPHHRNASPRKLEFPIAKRGIDYVYELVKEKPKKEFRIGFYGGEPLLNFPLIERIVEYAKSKFKHWKLDFHITTNGTLLNEKIAKFFIHNRFNVAISLDGPERNHDAKRIFPSGGGSFRRVYEALKLIKKLDEKYFAEKVSFSCVFSMDLSFKLLYEFFTQDELVNRNNILLGFVDTNKTKYYDCFNKNESELRSDIREIIEIIKLKKKRKEELYPIEEAILASIANFEDYLKHKNLTLLANSCTFSDKLFISADGKFYICEKMGNNFPIGSVENGLDFKIMKNVVDKFQETIRKKCINCAFIFLCNKCYATFVEGDEFHVNEEFCEESKTNIVRNLKLFIKLKKEGVI